MHDVTNEITVLLFGRLAEIAGTAKLELQHVPDTQRLLQHLQQRFPEVLQSAYILAVNGQIAKENTLIEQNAIIALMPPFSGG
ncbi:MoaD/ThiS family protein [Chitinophagaceae bacterium MMS25-I14]